MAQTFANQLVALLGMIRTGKVNMYTAFSKLSTILTFMNDELKAQRREYTIQQIWVAPNAASTTGFATEYELNTKDQTDCPIAVAGEVAHDYPRNYVVVGDTLTGATSVIGTITGKDQFGVEQVETFTVTTGSKTFTGSIAFSGVPVIVITTITGTGGANDSITVGEGVKFGLNGNILSETDALIKVNMDEDDAGVADGSVDATNNTITFETGPNAAQDYIVWFRAKATDDTFNI